jgi:ribosomal protein S12 methylthiotransferase
MNFAKKRSLKRNRALVGKKLDVVIDGYLYDEGVYLGRTYMDCPEIDGMVYVSSGVRLDTCDIAKVEITEAGDYDLTGRVVV